jgi:hypothetical protein
MNKKIFFALIVIAVFFMACEKATTIVYDCTGLTPTYTTDVKPLMDTYCATSGCHNATTQADNKDYSSYNTVSSLASSNSFMGSMEHNSSYKAMPEGGAKLSTANLQKIYCWIQNGKPQ